MQQGGFPSQFRLCHSGPLTCLEGERNAGDLLFHQELQANKCLDSTKCKIPQWPLDIFLAIGHLDTESWLALSAP